MDQGDANIAFSSRGMIGNKKGARKPRFSVFVAAVIVCVALIIVLRKGRTASMDIPKISASNLSSTQKAVIEKARHELEAEESADTWGQYGMVLRAFDFNNEALQCFRTARSLDPKNPRWPYFISRILRAPADLPIVDEFESEVAAIRGKPAQPQPKPGS